MFIASDGVTFTQVPWYHSSHRSHWIMKRPCHGLLQRQYSCESSAATVSALSDLSNSFFNHSGSFLSLHSFIQSWLTTSIDLRNCTLNSAEEIFCKTAAGPFQGLHSFLHLPFTAAVSSSYTTSPFLYLYLRIPLR